MHNDFNLRFVLFAQIRRDTRTQTASANYAATNRARLGVSLKTLVPHGDNSCPDELLKGAVDIAVTGVEGVDVACEFYTSGCGESNISRQPVRRILSACICIYSFIFVKDRIHWKGCRETLSSPAQLSNRLKIMRHQNNPVLQ